MKDWIPALMLNKNYCPNNYYVAPVLLSKNLMSGKSKKKYLSTFYHCEYQLKSTVKLFKKIENLIFGWFLDPLCPQKWLNY